MALSKRQIDLLEARGIDLETAVRLGVEDSPKPGFDIRIPYVEHGKGVNWKYRTLAGEKRFLQEAGGRKCFWNVDVLTDPSLAAEPLIITEGELDALIAIQCGFARTVSVPDGAPAEAQGPAEGAKYGYVAEAPSDLRSVKEIILATDADGPGVNLMHDLALRLGKARCKWIPYPKGCKDLNEAYQRHGTAGVKAAIARAQFIRVEGVYRLSELPPLPEQKPYDIGIPVLSAHYNIRGGDLCVVTGIPSHGKSSFINEVACRMADRYGWVTAFASFEQLPQRDHRRNLRTYFHRKYEVHQAPEERAEADAWIERQFVFIVPNEDEEVTLEWTLERCSAAVVQHGARIVVVDPWNEMDHQRPHDMSLTEYTGFAIKQFRKFARKHEVHVIVAAHPVKQRKGEDGTMQMPSLYDISDSAHWYNKADVGIVVHRLDQTRSIIRVSKSRFHDQIGVPGDVPAVFDPTCNRYVITDGA
jgi:twinkle protein